MTRRSLFKTLAGAMGSLFLGPKPEPIYFLYFEQPEQNEGWTGYLIVEKVTDSSSKISSTEVKVAAKMVETWIDEKHKAFYPTKSKSTFKSENVMKVSS